MRRSSTVARRVTGGEFHRVCEFPSRIISNCDEAGGKLTWTYAPAGSPVTCRRCLRIERKAIAAANDARLRPRAEMAVVLGTEDWNA